MRAAYIAVMDLDNRNAHAIQVMKNVQAWAKACDDFELVANLNLRDKLRLDPGQLAQVYGVSHPFAMHAFPLRPQQGRFNLPIPEPWFFQAAAARCARRGVDLVYTRTFEAPRHVLRKKLDLLVESHSHPEKWINTPGNAFDVNDPHFLGVVTITEELADFYRGHPGFPPEKVLVAPDGVDSDLYANPLSPREARARLGLDSERPWVVYAGHLYAGRGVEEIMAAAQAMPQVGFLLVGGHPPDVARWREWAAGHNLANVTLTGFVNNGLVPTHLWAGDLLLMPYGTACPTAAWMSPLKMFEYLAAGRAVIASDLPALKAVLRHGQNAWLTPPDDAASLTQAIKDLLAVPELRARLSAQALKDAAPFSWDARVANILAFAGKRSKAVKP
jgi:glycosyltransferase involved in cell wall biosynthesis